MSASDEIYAHVVREVEEAKARMNKAQIEPFDLDTYLDQAFNSASSEILRLMPEHAVQINMACSTMVLLGAFISEGPVHGRHSPFLAAHHRSTNLLLSIRHVLLSGLEEAARPLSRAFLESIDIALVLLTNEEFATEFFEGEFDFKKFWSKEIAYGKIYPHLRVAFLEAGFDEEKADGKIQLRKNQKNSLSSSVHGDEAGAFRSWAPPVLGYPDMLSLQQHGVVNLHTPDHVAAMVSETFMYTAGMMNLMISGKYDDFFKRSTSVEKRDRYVTHFFAFQERVRTKELLSSSEIVAPDYEPAEEEEC